jgi:GAF domain-containing protein
VTARKRAEQINQALFRIARALYRFPQLDRMLEYITRQVQALIRVAGALVILFDEEKQEFYIPVAAYEDNKTGSKMKEVRFPMDKGVAGHVYQTGEPLIVPDTAKSPYFYDQVDKQSQFHTKNMLDVPLRIQDRIIGVLCAVNKKEGVFNDDDRGPAGCRGQPGGPAHRKCPHQRGAPAALTRMSAGSTAPRSR